MIKGIGRSGLGAGGEEAEGEAGGESVTGGEATKEKTILWLTRTECDKWE